jgi:dihydrodipicolinate synthase/N-acetylneuraminate lyase
MDTRPFTPDRLATSVVAVPPLARYEDYSLGYEQNERLVRHIESGGVTTLLYGGNANLYHERLSEYHRVLALLSEVAADETLVIPSVGPAYGTMLNQAALLRRSDFPTAMILPQSFPFTPEGVLTGVRHFVEAFGRPAVLYIKQDGYVTVGGVRKLVDDGLLSAIKYAVVRDDPRHDDYLRRLVGVVDGAMILSGIGEQPAIAHLVTFGLGGFTSGCVCIAPALSTRMLRAIKAGDLDEAERIRRIFEPLENLRNEISPIRVLHEAVSLAGVADTGPILPLLSGLDEADKPRVQAAARALLQQNGG